jgi:predicted nucleic acid-binding Zn ribbon protein
MIQLKDLLQRSLNKAGIAQGVAAAIVCDDFSEVIKETFGAAWQKNCRPLYVKNKTITVACLNNIVAQEVKLRERQILAALAAKGKGEAVERIRFIV